MSRFPLHEPFATQDAVCEGRHTLAPSGELDIVSAVELESNLLHISRARTTGITLDLSRLTFKDSTGLRAVLFAKRLADRHGYEFSIVPGPPRIQRVFELVALLDVLPFQPDAANAISGCEPCTATELGS
jgi:anti-sigma B factor antagonist